MKIAYLAPELPALSATFVYNEIIQLEKTRVRVIPFSVHRPNGSIDDPVVKNLKQRVSYLYERSKATVLKSHFRLLTRFPCRYFSALKMLFKDVFQLGLLSRTGFGLLYRFFYSVSLSDDLIRHKCEHIHVHFAHIPTDIAMYAACLAGIDYSVTSHANDLFERGWLLAEKVERSAFFATISEFNKQFLAEEKTNIDKVEIIRCGVDLEQFSTRPMKEISKPIQLGMVGRLVEKKGTEYLVRALAILKQQNIDVVVSIAGSGPLEQELKQLAMSLGLDDESLRFLGPLPHKDVASFIIGLDVFVLPCQIDGNGDMDGIPVVLMEAMLSGVPVISTYISGIPELIVDGETGILVKPQDSEALAEAILSMVSKNTLRKDLIEKAVLKVKNEFSLVSNVSKLNGLFKAAGS
jgi:glycosyltransferase involved in cell wall biosynthesis